MTKTSFFRNEAKNFWEGIEREELHIQRCRKCKRFIFFPRQHCPHDMGELEYERVSGKGKIVSFTIVEKIHIPFLADKTPYVIAIIELDEGPTILSLLLHDDPSKVEFYQEVEVVFDQISEELTYPLFQLCQ